MNSKTAMRFSLATRCQELRPALRTAVGAMFLDNFDLNQFPKGQPIAQADKGGGAYPGNAWMALHNTGLGCCGGIYKVSDMRIDGGAKSTCWQTPRRSICNAYP
jgi:hypothetical protein